MIAIKTMPFFLSCVVSEGKTTWFESRAVNEDVTVCLITAWDVLINKMTFVKGMLTGGLVCVWFQMRFFFRQASSNLRDSFTMVFAQNSSIFHWAVHQPVAFFHVRSHTRRFEPLIEELWLPLRRHFFPCTHVHKLQGRCELSTLNKTLDWGRSAGLGIVCACTRTEGKRALSLHIALQKSLARGASVRTPNATWYWRRRWQFPSSELDDCPRNEAEPFDHDVFRPELNLWQGHFRPELLSLLTRTYFYVQDIS